jgi:hypothetical protein
MGEKNLFIKLGGDILGFIGENLGRAKGLMYLIFSFSHGFFFIIMVFQWVQGVDNSIKLKKIQIGSGDLRKRDKGLGIFIFFQKGFFGVKRGGWDNSTPFQKEVYFKRIGTGELFLGWGLTQRFVYRVAWEGEVWFFLKVGRWHFKEIPNFFFWVLLDGVIGERGWVYFFLVYFFFCDMVI